MTNLPFFYEHASTPALISLYLQKRQLQDELIKQICLNTRLTKLDDMRPKEPICKQEPEQTDNSGGMTIQKCQKQKKITKGSRNQTKNLTKNYGKAIVNFIEAHPTIIAVFLDEFGIQFADFMKALKERKHSLNSIANLRDLWVGQTFPYTRQMRILSQYFLRRASLKYIYESKVLNRQGHIKYRHRLYEALRKPQEFTYIKPISDKTHSIEKYDEL